MKKISFLIIAFVSLMVFSAFASEDNLHHLFKDYSVIKIYLNNVEITASHDGEVNEKDFREVFKEMAEKRINIKFEPVDTADQADVVVNAHIEEYVYRKRVLPRVTSLWALIADGTRPKSMGKLRIDYEITCPNHNNHKVARENFITEERLPVEDMYKEIAFIHSARRNVNRFLYRTFYEQK